MPISRYEIRNEYSLADPDLYRAAGNDDPEALLEGVAMAGLVGVLRQLGDLAEFAADIFHNLHEEAMATAARSHGLMSRVQQIEAELPHIERAFLSQTDHSSFFNHTVGVEWHPNLRIEQNLITQGDLPRLVMDSYEECRPPPRLFLLDKFDVAGAGACLKRYSDPSFFKLENYGMTNADVVPREKKIRKAKKKGTLWKSEETTEVLPTTHTKLHQLFMEEARIENGGRNPAQHAKLKRKLDGFPFNTKTGNSYMEKFLKDTSPDNEVVREVTMNSTPLVSATYDYNESGLQVVEVRPVSPHRENVGRNRSPPSFSEREIIVNSSIDDNIRQAPNLYPSIAADVCISSTHNEKIIGMDSYRELGSLTSYQWDDIVSEVDNYVDATSTVESDTDANSTLRVNSDFIPSHVKSDSLISDENEENLQIMSFDSQSTGDLTISDEDNNSSRKGMSSFSSDSPSTSVENTQSNTISTRVFSPEIIDHFPVDDKHSRPFVSDVSCTNKKSDYEQATSGSRVVGKGIIERTESNKTLSTLDDEEKRSTLVKDPPYSPSVSRKSSAIPYIPRHKEDDSSHKVTSKLLHWDESDREGQNSEENRAFKFNLFNVHSWETIGNLSERKSSEILIPGQDDEFQKLPNEFPSDYPDVVHNGDNVIKPMVSKEDSLMTLIRGLANGNSDVSNDSPDRLSCFKDTFRKKKLEEISSVDAEAIDDEDDHSERSIGKLINSKDVVLSNLEKSSDGPWAGHDAHKRDVILEEYMAVNENLIPGTRIGIKHHISPDDSEAQESSCSTLGEIEEPAGTSEYVEMDRTKSNGHEVTDKFPDEVRTLSMEDMSNTAYMVSAMPARADHASTGHEVTESFCSDDMISLNEVHILSDESDKSTLPDLAYPVPALSDNVMMDNIPSEIDPTKLVEEKVHSFEDSGIDEPEFANNPLSESHWKLGLAEIVDQTEAATSDFENNNHPQSELSGNTVYNSHVDVKAAEQCLELIHPETTKLPMKQIFVNDEHDIPQQSCLGIQVSDSTSLHVADISIVQENIGLHSRGIYSEVPPVLPRINDQQMPDLLGSILPISETNLIDTPPLPPLPPAQWMMMGKLQFGSSSLFPQLISDPIRSTDDDGDGDASSRYCPPTESTNNDRSPREEITLSLIQTANEPTLEEKLQLGSTSPFPQVISHPTRSTDDDDASYRGNPPTAYTSDDRSPLDDIAHSPIQTASEPASKEKPHPHLSSTEGEMVQHNEIFPQIVSHPIVYTDEIKISPIQVPDKPTSTEAKGESSGVEINSMHENDLTSKEDKDESFGVDVNALRKDDLASKEEKSESSHAEVSSRNEPVDLTPMIENNQQQSVMTTEEDRVANGGEVVKMPRLRHPLIDEVTALDKSKLRKVTERLRTPQVQKADQRNSMLEQIRTKSFNLKPALATRPSYRGPSTNLRVAAIVEKANAIRQAFAGSDEDDDDSWSDS